ncbi:MAG TPA: metallophosphoesterase [bacterium]|nr:metallophosphoesterase [bacterium]
MRPTLKIAHGSDIHLDTDYFGGGDNLAQRDQYRGVFLRLLERIQAERPHLMLLPGDLFDSNRASADTITWAMERLGALPFPVILIPGNHDCMEPGGIYQRHDFNRVPNLRLLSAAGGETADLPELAARAWGKGMVEHTPDYSPLANLPAPAPGRWNLGLGHGIYVGRESGSYRSSPVQAKQIEASSYDYIALGHHHALLDVSGKGTTAFYSGAPVPISRSSAGTFLTITLQEGQPAQVQVHKLP